MIRQSSPGVLADVGACFWCGVATFRGPTPEMLSQNVKKEQLSRRGIGAHVGKVFFFSGGADAHVALMHVAPFPIVPHENAPMAVRIEALWQVSIGPLVGWCADGVFRARCEIPGFVHRSPTTVLSLAMDSFERAQWSKCS